MASEFDQLIQLGQDITSFKYYTLATGTILFYDYLLTLSDEIKYYWSGQKSWTFWLFVINRYFPMTFQFWVLAVAYTPQSETATKACEKTAWYGPFMFTVCTLLAQIAVTARIYAVTKANVAVTAGFALIAVTELALGITFTVNAAKSGAQQVPDIRFDAFHLCAFTADRAIEIATTSVSLLYDFLAFSLVVYVAKTPQPHGLKIPKILLTIVGDSAKYFLVIFTSHLALELTLTLGRPSIRLLPGSGVVVYLPVMISRIMLSLRKAADKQQRGGWSLADPSGGDSENLPRMSFFRPRRVLTETLVTQDDIPLYTRPGRSETTTTTTL